MQIAVLGMHRSGTSVLTRLLGFIGCHLGDDDDFNPVRPDNPKGDWERADVWTLNEDVLSSLNATWCRIADFDLGRLEDATRATFENRARDVALGLDARRPWAIKDPRLCLTLPVWRPALESPVCVILHREPLAVARSLERRDGFPLAAGVALWEAHVLGALRHSYGLPRVAVDHRRLLDDAPSALRLLRQELESAGVNGLHDPDEAAVRRFIDPSLRHSGGDRTDDTSLLNPAQHRLAAALADGSALAWDHVPALSRGASDWIAGYFEVYEERMGLQRELSVALAERDGRIAEIEELNRQRQQSERDVAELNRQRRQSEHDVAKLIRQRQQSEHDVDELIRKGTELERLIELILASRRWRYGDRAGALLGKALLRPAEPTAAEHAERIGSAFRSACREIAQKRTADD